MGFSRKEEHSEPNEVRGETPGPPRLLELLGELVILNYTNGPFPESPFEIERGNLEARSGLFFLEEVSNLGIVVRKVREEGLLPSVFISWGAVHTIQGFENEEDVTEED